MKVTPEIDEKEVHIVLKKSIKAKEITERSVPGRQVEIVPKRDDKKRKYLRIATIACGAILILITVIFIGLKAAKCNGASSEGIFIGAVFVSVLGLIFGIATVVVLFLKMVGERK
ncbi:uncharacterized protein LOC124258233 isoform X2 [Haliotis rubra]|uniref:uncharacterized protein LOC124258233 isoform X2 n=1 Tax=Haliotis rubra TaxID=36100 RepID=UPI001EE58D9F|nr:uncharacterized protein LOC124258233 isoform X2 [Haliotis rubra]